MRSLATADYTAGQVEAQLKGPSCRYTARFQVLTADGRPGGDLDGLVHGAIVEFDTDREIMGSLDLEMLPSTGLADDLFRLRIKPWFGVVMPDGGVAEYPQGLYVWTTPDRDLGGIGNAETWTISLPDQGWGLEMGGPGTQPFRIDRGDRFTAGIGHALRRAGFDDTTGIVASDEETDEMLSWSRRRNIEFGIRPSGRWNVKTDTTPETWRTIIGDLTDPLGYDHLWFDPDGLPRAGPSVDLASADPAVVYATDSDSIMLPTVPVTHDLARVANRLFCRSKSKRGDFMNVGVADLNDLLPEHPLAERNIGSYIDIDIDIAAGQSARGLEAQARRLLYRRITALEELDVPTLAWPVHEAFELVGFRFSGDRQFDDEVKFHETGWGLTMVTEGEGVGVMNHKLRRVIGTAQL